jgi:hypothetical protein
VSHHRPNAPPSQLTFKRLANYSNNKDKFNYSGLLSYEQLLFKNNHMEMDSQLQDYNEYQSFIRPLWGIEFSFNR